MGQQIQVIDADATYQDENVQQFVEQRQLAGAGVKYTTVAIMGPQSSGKSTLLNLVVRRSCHRRFALTPSARSEPIATKLALRTELDPASYCARFGQTHTLARACGIEHT